MYFLLSRTQAGPGRTVKQEQEEISRNHVQTFSGCSVLDGAKMATRGRGPHCPSNLEHSVESRDRLDTRVVVVLATREKGAAGETKGIQGWLDEERKAGRGRSTWK